MNFKRWLHIGWNIPNINDRRIGESSAFILFICNNSSFYILLLLNAFCFWFLWFVVQSKWLYFICCLSLHFLNKELLGVCWMLHIWGDYDDLFFFEKKIFNAVRIGPHLSKLFASTFQPNTDQHIPHIHATYIHMYFSIPIGYDGIKQHTKSTKSLRNLGQSIKIAGN